MKPVIPKKNDAGNSVENSAINIDPNNKKIFSVNEDEDKNENSKLETNKDTEYITDKDRKSKDKPTCEVITDKTVNRQVKHENLIAKEIIDENSKKEFGRELMAESNSKKIDLATGEAKKIEATHIIKNDSLEISIQTNNSEPPTVSSEENHEQEIKVINSKTPGTENLITANSSAKSTFTIDQNKKTIKIVHDHPTT